MFSLTTMLIVPFTLLACTYLGSTLTCFPLYLRPNIILGY
jgi:hypothetical protein